MEFLHEQYELWGYFQELQLGDGDLLLFSMEEEEANLGGKKYN